MALLRSAFIALSHNRSLRRFAESSSVGVKLSSRFVAGMEIEDALRVCAAVNQQGMTVTLDSLGESVTDELAAHRAAEVYHKLLDAIAARNLNANISVKLTQMGLEHSHQLAESIAEDLTKHAASLDNFVRIDMEDSSLTQTTLDIVRRLHSKHGLREAIGVVIQAYLYRSQADIEQLMADGIRVRLCKGAYKEPAEVAFPRKADVDRNYMLLTKMLLDSPVVSRAGNARREYDCGSQGVRARERDCAQPLRVPDALRRAPRPATRAWCAMATTCACISPSGASGTRTSCGGWRSGQPMCSSSRRTC